MGIRFRCVVEVTDEIASNDWSEVVGSLAAEPCQDVLVLLSNPDREFVLRHPQSAIRCRLEINRRLAEGATVVSAQVVSLDTCTDVDGRAALCTVVSTGEMKNVWTRDPANCDCPPPQLAGGAHPTADVRIALAALPHIGRATADFLVDNDVTAANSLTKTKLRELIESNQTPPAIKTALHRFRTEQFGDV